MTLCYKQLQLKSAFLLIPSKLHIIEAVNYHVDFDVQEVSLFEKNLVVITIEAH